MGRLTHLLDTNIVSEPTRENPAPRVIEQLKAHGQRCCTCAPVLHELQYGISRLPTGQRRASLEDYLARLLAAPLEVLPYDREAALWHARARATLEAQGRRPAFVDGQIAAVCATNDLVLVTRNSRDFEAFPGLTVENWFE